MFEYTPAAAPTSVFVIGAGGTGGRLIPLLAQFLKTMDWIRDPVMYIVDHDIVEERNLKRQNFIAPDVNRHKAIVMAERYEMAYGTRIVPITEKITNENCMTFWATKCPEIAAINSAPLVIMCVDSAEARRNIIKSFFKFNQRPAMPFYIDSGNEDNFGQVQFFHPSPLWADSSDLKRILESIPELIPVAHKIDFSPMDIRFYANLKDTGARASCADLDQTLAINATMATTIMGIVQNYYYAKPFRFNRLNISLSSGSIAENNTIRNLATKVVETTDKGTFDFANQSGIQFKHDFRLLVDALYRDIVKATGALSAPKGSKEPKKVAA